MLQHILFLILHMFLCIILGIHCYPVADDTDVTIGDPEHLGKFLNAFDLSIPPEYINDFIANNIDNENETRKKMKQAKHKTVYSNEDNYPSKPNNIQGILLSENLKNHEWQMFTLIFDPMYNKTLMQLQPTDDPYQDNKIDPLIKHLLKDLENHEDQNLRKIYNTIMGIEVLSPYQLPPLTSYNNLDASAFKVALGPTQHGDAACRKCLKCKKKKQRIYKTPLESENNENSINYTDDNAGYVFIGNNANINEELLKHILGAVHKTV